MAKKAKKQRGSNAVRGNPDKIKGQGFHTHPERINRKGRSPKLIHHIVAELKEKGYTPVTESQIIDAYTALMQLPLDEVKAIEKDAKKPFFLRLVAKWLQSPKGMEMMDRIMDRSYGKVMFRQTLEANIKTEQPLFPDVTTPQKERGD